MLFKPPRESTAFGWRGFLEQGLHDEYQRQWGRVMEICKCGSFAINHHLHGRDGSMPDRCDVCYWREHHAELCKAVEDYCAECDNPAPDYAHRNRLRDHMLKLAKDGLDESQ